MITINQKNATSMNLKEKIDVLRQSGKYVWNFPLWRMASFEENYRSWWSWKMMEMRSEIWSLQADLLLQTSTSWAFESHAGRYFLSEIVKHIMRANLDELVFFFYFYVPDKVPESESFFVKTIWRELNIHMELIEAKKIFSIFFREIILFTWNCF